MTGLIPYLLADVVVLEQFLAQFFVEALKSLLDGLQNE
jgi:hypothetical protein